MNKFSYFVYKLGMMDKFGYTIVHAFIDVALIFGVAYLIGTYASTLA